LSATYSRELTRYDWQSSAHLTSPRRRQSYKCPRIHNSVRVFRPVCEVILSESMRSTGPMREGKIRAELPIVGNIHSKHLHIHQSKIDSSHLLHILPTLESSHKLSHLQATIGCIYSRTRSKASPLFLHERAHIVVNLPEIHKVYGISQEMQLPMNSTYTWYKIRIITFERILVNIRRLLTSRDLTSASILRSTFVPTRLGVRVPTSFQARYTTAPYDESHDFSKKSSG
jgi:hypothetical protein